ncbi:MAG: ester cyclase [Pseudomonadota bacterium]
MKKTLTAAVLAVITLAGTAFAGDRDTVRAFYTDILTDPAATTEERYYEVFSPEVVSIPTPPGGEGAQGMLNTIAFLGQVVPDLEWEPQEIIDLGDGRFVVRSLFRGTPVGPFFGVDPATGKNFEAMSIDIVTVEDGRITLTYHLEDWTGVIAQLMAE